MAEYVFGANILENLTTGMYKDSRVIYREYIQNACDQIDVAYNTGLFANKNEGKIHIDIDSEKRKITIEDNATGIARDKFRETLANIADSDKRIGEAKGFRGIGRLCGLAYCKKLIFKSKHQGEDTISIMTCDAQKMRDLISQSTHGNKHTASEILNQIYEFDSVPTKNIEDHWFCVELIDVNPENHALLDSSYVKSYLAFVAPVPYKNTFCFRSDVYKHAGQLNQTIDEYWIGVNEEQVFKEYKTHFKTSKGEDEIFDIETKDFYDEHNSLIAWMWFGVSQFKAIIEKDCPMRGIRLRKGNIQIGDEDALQKLFREDRGNHYFIGEIFAVSKDLIPNSQRDYFNENPTRLEFEFAIRTYFHDVLHRLYYEASTINNNYSKIDTLNHKVTEHQQKIQNGAYVDDNQRIQAEQVINKARQDATKAQKDLERKRANPNNSLVGKIITRIDNKRVNNETSTDQATYNCPQEEQAQEPAKPNYRTDKLSQYSKRERKLISRIFTIILSATDEQSAEKIISKIEEELQ